MTWWEGALMFAGGFIVCSFLICGGLVWVARNPQRLLRWWMLRAAKGMPVKEGPSAVPSLEVWAPDPDDVT